MKATIGIVGSAGGVFNNDVVCRLVRLRKSVAEHDCILIIGSCSGLPYAAAQGAKTAGGIVDKISTIEPLFHKLIDTTDIFDDVLE